MKHIYTFLFSLFLYGFIFAQTSIITDLESPDGIALNGTEFYIVERGNNKRVIKIDLSLDIPTITPVVTGLDAPSHLLLVGNDLYISDYYSGKIFKVDISANLPITNPTEVVTGLNLPKGMVMNGNDLYIACTQDNTVVKADISANLPITTATEVVTGLSAPVALVLRGNDLYIAESYSNRVSKADITATPLPTTATQIVSVSFPISLIAQGDYLYIGEENNKKISRIDLTAQMPTTADVLSSVDSPRGLLVDNATNTLYYSNLDKVWEYDLNVLSLTEKNTATALTIFPNPATEKVEILGLQHPKEYRIYNLMGAMVYEGKVSAGN